jgi:hypothetical protein
MEMAMPKLSEFQLGLCDEAQHFMLNLKKDNLEEAEKQAYFLYKRLQELNGNDE